MVTRDSANTLPEQFQGRAGVGAVIHLRSARPVTCLLFFVVSLSLELTLVSSLTEIILAAGLVLVFRNVVPKLKVHC